MKIQNNMSAICGGVVDTKGAITTFAAACAGFGLGSLVGSKTSAVVGGAAAATSIYFSDDMAAADVQVVSHSIMAYDVACEYTAIGIAKAREGYSALKEKINAYRAG